MQTAAPAPTSLRRLAEEAPDGLVVSLYVDLDPEGFATPPARASAKHSAVAEAEKSLERIPDLSHADQQAGRQSLDRARAYLEGDQLDPAGSHALALFSGGGGDWLRVFRLPDPVPPLAIVDRAPHIEPLARYATRRRWCVLLASRRSARLFVGSSERLTEARSFRDDVHGQHDQGGWSQARYARGIEEEVRRHLDRTAKVLSAHFRQAAFDHLLLGAPQELRGALVEHLPPELRERMAGSVSVDVEHASADQVLTAAREAIDAVEASAEREALDRLSEALGRRRGAAGLEDVLRALNEQRVELLLLDERFTAAGVTCPRCGWLGTSGTRCPADEGSLEERGNVVDHAVSRALGQAAEVMAPRHHGDLAAHGRIAALLRF
jgi:peptide chain release factor subunit 1